MLEPLHVPKNRSAYSQPLVARQPTAQASLASSRDWYRSPPLKSVLRCPNGHLTPSSQYAGGGSEGGGGVGGGNEGGGGGGWQVPKAQLEP